jgi:peptidyl-tRNA hydrolase
LAKHLALPTTLDDHLYQYAIVSGNLEMPAGKLAAQAGHAFGDSFAQAQILQPKVAQDYRNPARGGSKVVLRAKNQQQLIKAYAQALELGVPCALIVDQHHILPPHFTGQPVITALGLGPCTKDQARAITKKFQCV